MSKNIYIDSTFTEESVSGQTSIYTGEELVWGVNAFATLDAAAEAYDMDGTIYLSNTTLSAEYIPQTGYNLFLDKVTAAAITGAAGTTVETLSGVTAASIVGFDKVTITADQMLNVTDALSADTLEIKGDLAQRVLVKAGSIDFTDVPESIGLNVTANGSFVVNKTGKVYLGNQGVYDTRNGQARYNDYLFLDNGVNEVANTAYSLSNAKALAGADGTVVMTADLSKSGKVFAEGFKFAVSGAQVDTLYGDGVAAAAARAELTVSGTSSQVKNIYAAYKGITGDSLITVSDTTVAGVIDGSDSKVAGDSKLVLSGRVNAGTVTGFNTITIDGTGALVLTGAFDAASTNITIDASQYTGASKKLVKGASVTVNSDLINFIAGEEGQQIVVGTDYIAITTNKVVEAFVNSDWNGSNVPDTYGDSMLTWNVNAFNNVTDALAALEENGQSLYLVGGSITGDVNASNYALTIDNTDVNGSITGNGGAMVLKGSSEITGSLTNISSINWTPENGDVFTVGEGTVSANMTIDASKYVLAEDQLLQIVDADLAYRLEQVSDIKRGGENVYRRIVTSTITVNGTNYAVAVGDTGVYLRDFTHLNNRTYYSLNWSAADTGTRIGDDVIYFDRNARTTLSALCNDNTAIGGIITCYLNDNQTLNFEQDKLLSGFVVNGGTVNNFRSGKNGAIDPVNFGRSLTFNNVLIATGGDRWLGAGTNWTRTRTRLDTGAYAAGGMQRQYGNIDLIVNGGTTSGSSNNFRMFTWTQMWGDANISFTGTRLDSDFQGIGDVSFEGIWDGDTFVRNAELNISFVDCTSVNGKWYGARSGGWADEDGNTFGQLVDINFTFQNTRITGSRISTNAWCNDTGYENWTQGSVVFDVTASYLGENVSATDRMARENMATWREKVINVHYDANYDNNNSYITNAHWFNIVNIEAAARLRGETFNFHVTDAAYAQSRAIEMFKDQATGIQNAINVNAEGYTGKSKLVFQYGTVNHGDTVQVSVTGSELYDAYFTKDFTTVVLLEKNSDVYFNAGYSTDAPVSELDGVSAAFVGGATDESLGNAVASLSEAKDLVDGRTGAKIIFTGDSREEAEALKLDAEGYTLQVSGGSVTELIGAGSSADSVNLIVDGRAAVDKITVATASVSGDATVTLDGATIGGNVNGSDAKVAGTSELKLFNTTTVEGSVSGFNTITVDATAKLYAQSVNATNIQIDVADYTGSSCLISSVTGTITGNASVINNSEGIYSARVVSGNKLFLISSVPTDTYFNTSWDSSIENTEYNGTVLVWNNNAFNSAADAFGKTNKDVYMVGGTQADALDTGAVNFIVDATNYGVASLNSLSGSGKLTLNGTATFAAGATISGYSALNFTVTADTCLTLDAITLAEGGTLTIDASAITDFAGQTYTLVSTANGITTSNLRVSGGAFGVYNSGSEILLVKTNNLYLDANFDASISGTVNETTGEIMYFGANAFNTAAALRTGTLSSGKIYVTQDGEKTLGSSIYGSEKYDMEVVGVTASTVYAGNQNNPFVSDEDHTVIVKGSTVASVRGYAQGNPGIKQIINGKSTLVIEDSVVDGQTHPTVGEGDDGVVDVELHGDIDMTIRNSTLRSSFIAYGEVGKATKDDDGNILSIDERVNATIAFDKVVANDNFYGIRFNTHDGSNPQVMAFDQVKITITGYTGTGFYGICEWVGGTDRPVGNFFGNFDVTAAELNTTGAFQLFMTDDRHQFTDGIPMGESKVVIKNVEGYSTSNTVGGRMCGMAELVLENGVSLTVGDYLTLDAAKYSAVTDKLNTITMAYDSVLSVANAVTTDTITVDLTGYTGGNYMVTEAGSYVLNGDYNDGKIVETGSGADHYFFTVETTGDAKVRTFVLDDDLTSNYIYVNVNGFDGGTMQATKFAATGEYLFNNYEFYVEATESYVTYTNTTDWFDTGLLSDRQAHAFYVTGGSWGDAELTEDVETVIGGGTFNTLTVSEAIDLSMDNGLIGTLTMDGGSFVLNGGTVSDIKAGKTDVTLNKNFNGDIEAKSIALGGNKLSSDTVSASSLTMTVNGRIDATTASFNTITIDMTGYTGETFTIGTADSFTAKLVNLVNVEEGYSYTSRVIDNNLMVISMEAGDTFANATWTQATCPVMYNGQILGWNNNAFNNVVSAINNVADGYTVYLLSDSAAFDILGKNMIIRNDANVNAITIGDISDSTEAVNSLVIDGMVTAGAIGGIESITYKAQDGCYLSGAQIELGEGQVLTIDTKALTYEGTKAALGGQSGNYFKILDSSVTVNGEAVTAANIRLTESSRFKIYETEDGIYLLNMGKVYYDAGYTTETTGTYDDETGDYLIHEVNAFSSSKGTAASAIYAGLGENTLVYDAKNGGANSVSTRDNKDINMIIQGGVWTGTIQSGCNTSDNHAINYDRYVEINGATVTGGTMYLIGAGSTNSDNYAHEPRYNGTVTAVVKDSRVVASDTQGFSLTRYAVHNNDVSLTFENSVVGYDVRVTWYGVHAADTTVSLNFINSSFSAEKWIAVTQSNDIAGHIVAHIYGSSFTGSGFRFAANNRNGSMTNQAAGTEFYIAGSTISGYAYGGCSGQENDDNATGVKTLYVEANEYGTESYIRCAVMFDQVVIDAAATFNGQRIMFTTRNGLANIVIDATGYTGGSRIVSHMTNTDGRSYENLSSAEDAISVTGSSDYIGVRVNAADVAIVSLKSNIYVNADYDESVNGTIINGDLLIYDVTATNDLGNGFSIVEERGNVANVVVTGGEFDDISFDRDKKLFFADKANVVVDGSVSGGTFTFDGAATMTVDGSFEATNVNATADVTLTVDGDFTATNFVIDVTGYTGGSTRMVSSDNLSITNVTILGDDEGSFRVMKNATDLYLVSKNVSDTFYNANFTSAVDGKVYNGKLIIFNGDGKNAFTSMDDAVSAVADGSTVFALGGSYDDFNTEGVNFVFDGSANAELSGGAISMKSIDATGSKIGFAGTVTFAAGSSITGAVSLDYAPDAGECLTVNAIEMAENGKIYINASNIDFSGTQLYKVMDIAGGLTNATAESFSVLNDQAGIYTVVDEETEAITEVDVISHYNLYMDTSYTDAISGTVFEATGDTLYFGGNAYNSTSALRSAAAAIVDGGTMFVTNDGETKGAINGSIYGGYGYDLVINGATALCAYGGQHQGNGIVYGSAEEESTRYVVVKDAFIYDSNNAHAGLFGLDGNGGTATRKQVCYSNLEMTIEGSTIGLLGMVFADEDGAITRAHMYGDIDVTVKDSYLAGPSYITYGSIGDEDNYVDANITFENVTAGNNFWGIRCNETADEDVTRDYFGTITINVKDSSFNGFGGICRWGGATGAVISVENFVFNITGSQNKFNEIHGHIYAWGTGFTEEGNNAVLNIGNDDDSAMALTLTDTGTSIIGFSEINIGKNVAIVAGSTVMAELGDSKITMDISSSIKSNGVVYADSLYVNADDYEGGDKVVISGSTMAIGSGEVSNYDYNVQIGTKAVVVYDSTVTNAYVNLDMEDGLAFTGDVDALTGDIMVYYDGNAGQNLTDNFDTAKDLVGEDYSIYLVGGTIGEAATEEVSGTTGYLYADGKSIVVEDALFANDVILTSEYSGEIESTSVTLSGGTYNGTVFMAAEDYTVVDAKLYLSGINSDITIDGANDYTETSSVYITGSATVKEIVNVDSLTFNMADGAKELKLTNNFQGNITIDVTDYDMGGSQVILTQASAFDLSKVTMVGNDSGRYSFTNLDGSLYVYDSVNVSNTYVCQEWTATTVPAVYRGSFLTWNKNAFNTLEDGLAAVAEGCAVYLKGGTYGAFTSTANLVITELVTVDGILDASNVTVTIDATDFDFGGAKYIKVLDVAEGSTFGTVNLINQNSSTYLFKMDEDYYLADLSSGNAYYNSSIRDQAKINELTGEVMILGVNYEWNSMTTAANEVKGGTLFIDQTFRTNESTLPAGIFDCVITGTSIGAAWHMQPQTNGTITGDLNLLIKDSYIQSNWLVGRGNNYQDERTFNGKINVAIEGCTVGQLDLGIRTVYSQGFKVSIKDSLLTGVFGESDDQAGLSDDSPVRGGTTELSIVNCTVVSGSSHRIALYRPGWDYTANAIITIENSDLGNWIVGVTGPANNKAPEGTVTVNFAGSTVAQLRGAKCSSDNDNSVSIFAKTLNLYGGESYVAHFAQRFNHLNITVQNETEDQKGTLLVAETLRLQDDNDNVASITIDLTGYTGGSRQVVRTFGTAADQGLRITDMNNGGAMHIVTPTIKGSTEFKGIMGRHAVAIYRDADLQKATYIGSYTADNNADMSYNNQDVLVVGTNAFSDFDEGFARAGKVKSDLYIASGTYTGLSQFNFTGKFEINTGAVLAYGDIETITITGEFVNNGTFTVDPSLFDKTVGYAKVLSATSITGAGKYDSGSDEWKFIRVANDLYIAALQDETFVSADWAGYSFGDKVQGGLTIGVNAFGDTDTAKTMTAEGGKITIVAGSTPTVFDGGISGTTVSGVLYASGSNVEFNNDTLLSTTYAGAGNNPVTPVSKTVTVNNTSITGYLYSDKFTGVEQEGNRANITMNVSNVEVKQASRGVFGGGNVSGENTLLSNHNVTATNTSASLFVGGHNIVKDGTAEIEGDYTLTLNNCSGMNATSSQMVIGGSQIGNNAHEVRKGNTTININGGSVNSAIYGGSLVVGLIGTETSTTEGNITINIGGDFHMTYGAAGAENSLYGAAGSMKLASTLDDKVTVTGNVAINIDYSEGASLGNFVFAGGYAYAKVDGNATITLKGELEDAISTNFKLDSRNGQYGTSFVTGDRELKFENFKGEISGIIESANKITIDKDSAVELSSAYLDFGGINWDISGAAGTTSLKIDEDFNASFAMSQFNLHCDDLTEENSWTVLDAKAGASLLEKGLDSATVTFNGVEMAFYQDEDICAFINEEYMLTVDEENGDLIATKFGEIA